MQLLLQRQVHLPVLLLLLWLFLLMLVLLVLLLHWQGIRGRYAHESSTGAQVCLPPSALLLLLNPT